MSVCWYGGADTKYGFLGYECTVGTVVLRRNTDFVHKGYQLI